MRLVAHMPNHAGDRGAARLDPVPHDHLHINQIRMKQTGGPERVPCRSDSAGLTTTCADGIPLAIGSQLTDQCECDVAEPVHEEEEVVVCGTGDHGAADTASARTRLIAAVRPFPPVPN